MTKKKKSNLKWYTWLTLQQIGLFLFFVFSLYFLLGFIDQFQAQSSLGQVRNYIKIYNEDYMDNQIKNIQANSLIYKIENGNINTLEEEKYDYSVYKNNFLIYGEQIYSEDIPEKESVSYSYDNNNIIMRQHIISEEYDIYVVKTIDVDEINKLQKQLEVDIIFRQQNGTIISTTEEYNKDIFSKIESTDKEYLKLEFNGVTYIYVWENFYNEKEDFIAIGVLQQTANTHLIIIFSFIQFIVIFIFYIFQIFLKHKTENNMKQFHKKIKIKTNFNLFI